MLPGQPAVELREGGENTPLTTSNITQYLQVRGPLQLFSRFYARQFVLRNCYKFVTYSAFIRPKDSIVVSEQNMLFSSIELNFFLVFSHFLNIEMTNISICMWFCHSATVLGVTLVAVTHLPQRCLIDALAEFEM